MGPVIVFFGVATLVGGVARGFLGLRRHAVTHRAEVSEGDLCRLDQAGRVTSVTVIASVAALAVAVATALLVGLG